MKEPCDEDGGVEVGELEAVSVEAGAEAPREPVEVAFDAEAAGRAVRHEVDARGWFTLPGGLQFNAVAAGQMNEHGLDVLAGAKAVDPEIRASTAELAVGDVANSDAVAEPTARFNLKVGEHRVGGVKADDAGAFITGADLALDDLVSVGGAPVSGRGKLAGRIGAMGAQR